MSTPFTAKTGFPYRLARIKSSGANRNPACLAIDILFIVTICAQLVPVWFWTYFPSLDGPSHLYNASILLNYSKIPLYQQYYRITYDTPGNVLTQLVLSSLLTVLPPLVAEKTFLTLYLVSFPVAFRGMLQSFGGDARSFSFFAVVLSYNHFLHMGFWNFCAGIPLALATLAYIGATRNRPLHGGRFAMLLALALATYLCHPLAWGMTVLVTAWILAWEHFGFTPLKRTGRGAYLNKPEETCAPPVVRESSGEPLRPFRQRLLTAGAVVLPSLLYLLSTGVRGRPIFPRFSFWGAAQSLYQLGFLSSYGWSELWLRRTVLASVVVLMVFAALTGGLRRFKNPMLILSLACAPVIAFGPDSFGALALIRERLAIFAFLFLCAGLATIDWPKRGTGPARPSLTPDARSVWPRQAPLCREFLARAAPVVLAVFLSGLSLIGTWRRQPAYKYWNERLAEYAALAPRIPANSVLLTLCLTTPEEHSSPTVHAAENWTPKPFIELSNFEARDVIFPVRFRNMGSAQADIYAPLNVYLERLGSEQFQLDYILFDAEPARLMRPEELEGSSGILKEFALDYASPPGGHLRLYRRRKQGSAE